jgi:hypothetical protein
MRAQAAQFPCASVPASPIATGTLVVDGREYSGDFIIDAPARGSVTLTREIKLFRENDERVVYTSCHVWMKQTEKTLVAPFKALLGV